MEVIKEVKEGSFKFYETYYDYQTTHDGYIIVTDQQEIKIGVDNGASCCEDFGYIASEDDLSALVGRELKGIEVVDTGLTTRMIDAGKGLDEGDIMFVNILTDQNVAQFAVYNGHNGYYGHTGVVISKQLNHEKDL